MPFAIKKDGFGLADVPAKGEGKPNKGFASQRLGGYSGLAFVKTAATIVEQLEE